MATFLPWFLLGLGFAAVGVLITVRGNRKKSRCTASTVATITEVVEKLDIRTDKPGEARRYRYIPTYSYQVNGKAYAFKGVPGRNLLM